MLIGRFAPKLISALLLNSRCRSSRISGVRFNNDAQIQLE